MGRGGYRLGAGRKQNSSKFGEATMPIRVPKSAIPKLKEFLKSFEKVSLSDTIADICESIDWQDYDFPSAALPIFSSKVAAGFPSPGDDHWDAKLDLNEHLVQHPAATFFVRVSGDSMIGAGINDGDVLIVDRSIVCKERCVIIAVVNGELTVKRFSKRGNAVALVAENPKYQDIIVTEEMDFRIWGVVTTVIHKL